MDKISKRLYMREHSNVIRKFQSLKMLDKMEENPVFNIDGTNRLIIVTICRIRQRILTQAWRILTQNTRVKHDYELDARVILSRKLPEDELRTELEIEILFKWIYNTKDIDPTGIANTIYLCKKRAAVYNALQQMRLEFYEPGDTVLFQGDIPRPEDGHFTIFNGVCEVLQFPDESMPLMKLLYLAKKRKWDEAKKLLKQALVLARITKSSGFGELSTLTGVKRAATIRTDPTSLTPVEVLVLPKQALLDCLKSRRQDGVDGAAPSEAMDFMRQSGLANRISPKDLVRVAQSMVRRTLLQGEILYYKNETVKSLFLVVSGELLLDTGDFMLDNQAQPFINSNPDNCFHMPSGSILGDEGVTGQSNRFESTAVVVSEAAVVFEAVGFGMNFLTEKIGALRYCALTYRDKSRWSPAIHLAEEINPYTYFHSLRKAIAYTHPYRGSRAKIYEEYVEDKRIAKKDGTSRTGKRKTSASGSVRSGGGSSGGRGAAPAPQKYGLHKAASTKRLSPLVRLDSNLAFMLTADSAANTGSTTEFSLSRQLKPVGLHHALDINRTAKKLAQKFVKVHAQENILYDEMTKNLSAAAPGAEMEEAEAKFKNYIAEYRDRAVKHANQINKEMERERLSRAYTSSAAAVKFYGALSPDNSDEENNFSLAEWSDGDSISQKKPFSGGAGKSAKSMKRRPDEDVEKEKSNMLRNNTLNASAIEKELARALRASDEAQVLTVTDPGDAVSLASYEDEFFHTRPRIVQYFIWMDHLNRHTYRALLQQAQQTIDQNFVKVAEQKLVVTEKTMEELNLIFNRFGLTPTDMNIPWRPNTPKAAGVQFEHDDDDHSDEEELRVARLLNGLPPLTPVPTLDTKALTEPKAAKVAKTVKLPAEDAPRGRVKIPGKLIVYHPASWRSDMAGKKDKGTNSKENYRLFSRSTTPDNRRITWKYYHYPGHHHPDFFAREGHHQHTHHAGDHSPHRTLSGRYSGKSSPHQSRPSTAQSQFRTNSTDMTELETREEREKKEHIEALQATFNDVPDRFIEAIKSAEFVVRKDHLPKHEWSTRFMQTSSQAVYKKPEPEPREKMYRKSSPNLKPLPKRSAAASANFSKQAMLGSAKTIQANNEQMYELTDSARIVEASLNRIKARHGHNHSHGQGSFQFTSSTKTARTEVSAVSEEAQLVRQDSQDLEDDGEYSANNSLGNPSYDEEDNFGDPVPLSPSNSRPDGAVGEGEPLSDDDEARGKHTSEFSVGGESDAPAHANADTPGGQGDAHSPNTANSDNRMTRGGGSVADEMSIGNGTANEILDQSQLSPVAPAPYHLDTSVFSNGTIDGHLNAAMGSPLKMLRRSPSPPPPLLGTIENPQSFLSSEANTARLNQGSSTFSSTLDGGSRVDGSGARVKEIRDRIQARGSSLALEEFNQYMSTDNNPRKFYVGKKKASANSKFGLAGALKASKADAWKPTKAEIELFGTQKSSISSEVAMFNSLFPDCTEAQRKLFIDKCRLSRANGGLTTAAAIEMAKSVTDSHMSVKDLRLDEIAASAKSRQASSFGLAKNSSGKDSLGGPRARLGEGGFVEAEEKEEKEEEGEDEDLDPDVVLWQSFTIDLMHKEKTGPKKILPVLIMKNEGGASSRRFAVNKSKRWGSGVLLQLASEAEEDPISGPSSYLEIFKGTQRRRLREKDRLRITEELRSLAK